MALNSLYCADVPLSNYSLTHSATRFKLCNNTLDTGVIINSSICSQKLQNDITNIVKNTDRRLMSPISDSRNNSFCSFETLSSRSTLSYSAIPSILCRKTSKFNPELTTEAFRMTLTSSFTESSSSPL